MNESYSLRNAAERALAVGALALVAVCFAVYPALAQTRPDAPVGGSHRERPKIAPPPITAGQPAPEQPQGSPGAEAAAAQGNAAQGEQPKKLKPGVIASYGKTKRNTAIDVDTSGSAPGDTQVPIAASVRRLKPTRCEAVVTNTSETEGYRVSFAVQGPSGRGQSFSATLQPKQTVSRTVSCKRDEPMQVVLRSGTPLKKPADAAPPADAPQPVK